MPGIERIDILENAPEGYSPLMPNVSRYLSPDFRLMAVFTSDGEYRMGWSKMEVHLRDAASGEALRHPALEQLKGDIGFDVCRLYEPWDRSGSKLFLHTICGPAYIYDCYERSSIEVSLEGQIRQAMGSRTMDRYLVTTDRDAFILDTKGNVRNKLEVRVNDSLPPKVFWFRSGVAGFGVQPHRPDEKLWIDFFDGRSAKRLCSESIDSDKVARFDPRFFDLLDRTTEQGIFLSPETLHSTMAMFDGRKNDLFVQLLRSCGDAQVQNSITLYPQKVIWLRIRLTPQEKSV